MPQKKKKIKNKNLMRQDKKNLFNHKSGKTCVDMNLARSDWSQYRRDI